MDDKKYNEFQDLREKEWENICINCGACCGALGDDPCENVYREGNKYLCKIYSKRLGFQKTVGGVKFNCVPLRYIINHDWPGDHNCAYKKKLKQDLG